MPEYWSEETHSRKNKEEAAECAEVLVKEKEAEVKHQKQIAKRPGCPHWELLLLSMSEVEKKPLRGINKSPDLENIYKTFL